MNWIVGEHKLNLMELNADYPLIRFREIPPFGADGIRRITSNRSELKKMTARDFEDMLQVGGVIG